MLTQKQKKRFLVTSGIGKQQTTKNVAMADDDLDTLQNCTFTIEEVVTAETVYDCSQTDVFDESIDSRLKRITITYSTVTAQIIAMWLAYFLSAATAAVLTSGKYKSILTRSSDDSLAGFSFIEGFEGDTTPAQKYKDFKVDSLAFSLNRRRNLTLTVVAVGNYQTEDVGGGWEKPECENLPGLKGKDCSFTFDGDDLTELLWQAGINLSNAIPTGDDAFPFDSEDVDEFERGEKPTYPSNVQLLGSKGDDFYTAGENRAKVPTIFQFGKTANDHVKLFAPTTLVKLAATPTVFVGELNRSAVALDLNPHRDATLQAPIKAESYLAQTASFLQV